MKKLIIVVLFALGACVRVNEGVVTDKYLDQYKNYRIIIKGKESHGYPVYSTYSVGEEYYKKIKVGDYLEGL